MANPNQSSPVTPATALQQSLMAPGPKAIQGQNGETMPLNNAISPDTSSNPNSQDTGGGIGSFAANLGEALFNIFKMGAANSPTGGSINAITQGIGSFLDKEVPHTEGTRLQDPHYWENLGDVYKNPASFQVGDAFQQPVAKLASTPGAMDVLKTQAGGTAALFGGADNYRAVMPDMPSDTYEVTYKSGKPSEYLTQQQAAQLSPEDRADISNAKLLTNKEKADALAPSKQRDLTSYLGNAAPGSQPYKDITDSAGVVAKTKSFIKQIDQAISRGDVMGASSLALQNIDLLKLAEDQKVTEDQREQLNSILSDTPGFFGIGQGKVFHPEAFKSVFSAIQGLNSASTERFNDLAKLYSINPQQQSLLLRSDSKDADKTIAYRSKVGITPNEASKMQTQLDAFNASTGKGQAEATGSHIKGYGQALQDALGTDSVSNTSNAQKVTKHF